MNIWDILSKRRHIHKFSPTPPPHKTVEECLYKTWNITPSKNNFMPYHISVLGPHLVEEKEKIVKLSRMNKKITNEEANVNDIENYEEEGLNVNFDFISSVPYLLVCSQRVCEKANPYIHKSTLAPPEGDNNIYEQMHEDKLEDFRGTCGIELGLFKANLTAFCLEQGIDVSCISCTMTNPHLWREAGFDYIEHGVMLLIGLGYCETARRSSLTARESAVDVKPDYNTIVRFI